MTAPLATCRGCGAPIRWVRTEHGNLMPLDADPDVDGNVELVDPVGQTVSAAQVAVTAQPVTAVMHGQPTMTGGDRWMPHHATCPNADDFRDGTS